MTEEANKDNNMQNDQVRTLSTLNAVNKVEHSAFNRNHLPLNTKSKSFNERKAKDDRMREMKLREKEFKDDVTNARKDHTNKIIERRKAKEEKDRLAMVKSKVSIHYIILDIFYSKISFLGR